MRSEPVLKSPPCPLDATHVPFVTAAVVAGPKPKVTTPDVDTKEEIKETLAPLYRVICHDDPVTTMDFVIKIFRSVFRMTQPRAVEMMLRVHHAGAAVIGHYPKESAERKVKRATALARADKFPLTFTIEKAE